MFFAQLTWNLLQQEISKWTYSLTYLTAEIILALIIAFTSVKPTFGPMAFEVRYGVFATVRAVITFLTIPMHINAFKLHRFIEYEKARIGRMCQCYFALMASLLPLRFLGALLITAIVYPIVELRAGFGHVLVFMLIILLQTMTGITLSLLISATFTQPAYADVAAAFLLSINIIFAGTLLPPPRILVGLRWMHYSAYSFFATVAYNQNEYAGRIVEGASGYPSVQGRVFLRAKGLDQLGLWGAIGGLALHCLMYITASIFILEAQSLMRRHKARE